MRSGECVCYVGMCIMLVLCLFSMIDMGCLVYRWQCEVSSGNFVMLCEGWVIL